ncbi:hypothetical protein [Aquisalibacillus elongatus]|uniref:SPOR domain-containing protein n=1 Tax=Aquisalibacillus elongatus TaxID=485577 RepID=A0A3N5BJN4_9BACI|nr:hypothetical protein [Aquisalibacillus elongatus]RPF55470.1 hypothetical protein EDC24_0347 [Aquisalibacillus elongatus]
MDERKKVRVTMNQNNESDQKHDLEYFLTPKGNSKKFGNSGRIMLPKILKPIMLALLLGVIFGAGIIYFFSDMTPGAEDDVPVSTVGDDDEENDSNEEGNEDSSSTTFEKAAEAYDVIQFGVFSNRANADELVSDSLNPLSVPAVVQEENGQFLVISHLVLSEQNKDDITNWFESNDLVYMDDFFYKTWNFDAVQLDVSENEFTWLNEGKSLIESVQSGIDKSWVDEVNAWLDQQPKAYQNSESLEQIKQLTTEAENTNQTLRTIYQHTILLNMHIFYDSLA